MISHSEAGERTDFIVNDDGGVTTQNSPRIAVANDQGFVVAWADRRNATSDIYLQRHDSAGLPIGPNIKINDDSNDSYQFEPAVAVDLSGLYSVAWKDYRNGTYPFGPDIYFQSFDSSFALIDDNLNLTADSPDSLKESPDISLGEWGGGVVVWADYRNNNWDIYGRIFSYDGTPTGSDFRVNDDVGSYQQHSPRVSVAPQGWFVVAWYDNRGGEDDIFIQRFDSAGNKLGVNVKVNSDGQYARQAFPDVAAVSTGHIAVTWVDWRNGAYPSNPDVYFRKFDTLMVPLAAETKMNSDGTLNAQRDPALAVDRMGNLAIVWSDSTASRWNLTGQMINSDGSLNGANFTVNSSSDSSQLDPDIGIDGEYRYVTWTDKRSGNWDIYACIEKYREPSLSISPANVTITMREGDVIPSGVEVVVSHEDNPVQFSVNPSVDWLTSSPTSGTSVDTVSILLSTDTLAAGTYFGAVTFIDTLAHDSSQTLSVRLDVLDLPDDTITVDPATVGTEEVGSTPIVAQISNEATLIVLPLQYDTEDLTVDSVVAGPTLPADIDLSYTINATDGLVAIEWQAETVFETGFCYLADLYFTAGTSDMTATIDTVCNDTLVPCVYSGSILTTPVFYSGEITITITTAVEDQSSGEVPGSFGLNQNRPNPFNANTIISYTLPRQAKVTLEVYNILGQAVRTLVSEVQAAGEYTVDWDGRLASGHPAPSGVYFYRLQADSFSTVRRMVMIK